MLSNLRLSVGLSKLAKQSKTLARHRMVHNLETARSIGIICPVHGPGDLTIANRLMDYLAGLNLGTCLMAYVPLQEIPPQYLQQRNANFFGAKDLNWYRKPLSPSVDEFMAQEFDILMDLSMTQSFPLRWIATLSRAKFKVGKLSYPGNPNDLVISIGSNQSLEYFISQMKHYLNLINNRFAQLNQELEPIDPLPTRT